MNDHPVVIIGGGLAGLCCARELQRANVETLLIEAKAHLGGRVATDLVEGFRLDHGFQVLQTAYPEAQRQLNYATLALQAFDPGALIYSGGKMPRMSDPWRQPSQAMGTLFNGIGSLRDRWRLFKLRRQVTTATINDLWQQPNSTTDAFLRDECGFSSDIIQRFFRPWFRGVFLEESLETSSRFFRFVFRMLAVGDAALPELGMAAIPQQIANELPVESVRTSTRVASIDGSRVHLEDGEVINSRAIVIAADRSEAQRLSQASEEPNQWRQTTCYYFAADEAPTNERMLILNGDDRGPINNLCVPSNVATSYAPAGRALISASVIGNRSDDSAELDSEVERQLASWFGDQTKRWTCLRTYTIPHALPAKAQLPVSGAGRVPKSGDGRYVCGDYTQTASINGALESGRLAAEAVIADLANNSH